MDKTDRADTRKPSPQQGLETATKPTGRNPGIFVVCLSKKAYLATSRATTKPTGRNPGVVPYLNSRELMEGWAVSQE